MVTLLRAFALAALLTLNVAPAMAQHAPSDEALAERRLRACLVNGSAGAPKTSLAAAVAAVRALCRVPIKRLLDERLRAADARFNLPDTALTPAERDAREKAREAASRALNDEVVVAVSNFTGLTR